MLRNFLEEKILQFIGFNPTEGQHQLAGKLSYFIVNRQNRNVFILKGYAGTGKTSILSAMVKSLYEQKINFVLLAPTGRSAKVLSEYTGFQAYTIHKKIYRQKSQKDGFGLFELNFNTYRDTLFIVDEASLINNIPTNSSVFGSGNLLKDLMDYIFSGYKCSLLLCGDDAQLPPIGSSYSAALHESSLNSYHISTECFELTEVVRQSFNSGILMNATAIRRNIEKKLAKIPLIKNLSYKDCIAIKGNEILENLEDAYNRYGFDEVMIICRSNKRANLYNKGIREKILFRDEEMSAGDLLMVVKNNYFWTENIAKVDFIANGDIAKVLKIYKYEEIYDLKFAHVDLYFADYDLELNTKLIMNTLYTDYPSLLLDDHKTLLNKISEDSEQSNNKSKTIKQNPYFNALQVKFAYAVTCHKSQGGQWKSVFIDPGYIDPEKINLDLLRWLYTAFTRATEKIYLVNFNPEFLEG